MRILLLNQAFHPDVVSTAQHLADLAEELAARGHEVHVVCSRRGYDDPSRVFPREETWNGVRVHRVRHWNPGKGSKWRRAAGFASFMAACALRVARLRKADVVVALTSPPLISHLAMHLVQLRGGRLVLWVMDLNPDEAVAAGWLRRGSLAERALARMLAVSLRRADAVVALDDFMAARLAQKRVPPERLHVTAPWPHEGDVRWDEAGRERFRREHGLSDTFAVMYSGNHSPCHPLDTLIEAADLLCGEPGVAFLFVGGGSEWGRMREQARRRDLPNVKFLPYQPREDLSASLCAADFHAVVMGNDFVGIIHPSKIYNVLALGTPVLYVGPRESATAELLEPGWSASVRHGDAEGVVSAIARFRAARVPRASRLPAALRQAPLVAKMVEIVENPSPAHATPPR